MTHLATSVRSSLLRGDGLLTQEKVFSSIGSDLKESLQIELRGRGFEVPDDIGNSSALMINYERHGSKPPQFGNEFVGVYASKWSFCIQSIQLIEFILVDDSSDCES